MTNLMNKAMNATYEPPKQVYFGQLEWTMRPVKFAQEDDGKWVLVECEENDPKADVEITLNLYPLKGDYEVSRKMLANSNKRPDWSKITLPSLQKIGVKSMDIIYRAYVCVEMIKAGSYVKDGERKDRTTMKFLAIYPDRAACEAAAEEHFKPHNNGNGNGNGVHPEPTPAPAASAVPDNPMRAFAVQSLPALWQTANQNPDEFEKLFNSNPTYAQVGLNLNSPEVMAVTGVGNDDEIPF